MVDKIGRNFTGLEMKKYRLWRKKFDRPGLVLHVRSKALQTGDFGGNNRVVVLNVATFVDCRTGGLEKKHCRREISGEVDRRTGGCGLKRSDFFID